MAPEVASNDADLPPGAVSVQQTDEDTALAVSQGATKLCSSLHLAVDNWRPPSTELFDFWGRVYGDLALRTPQYELTPSLASAGDAPAAPAQLTLSRQTDGQVQVCRKLAEQSSTECVSLQHPENDLIVQRARVIPESAASSLQFERVALGGTFDRLHAGHRLLLAVAAAVAQHCVHVGMTDGAMLERKQHRELLESYEHRCDAVQRFVSRANSALACRLFRMTSAEQPTPAETEADVGALVASEETLAGAEKINEGRKQRALQPLVLIIVPTIGAVHSATDKLSSTALRAKDALRAAHAD